MILWPFEQRSQALGEVKARMIHNIVNIVFINIIYINESLSNLKIADLGETNEK